MTNSELLKQARDKTLGLHKSLIDLERTRYEHVNGEQTSTAFLNLLIDDAEFAWLRKFSTLIVDVDEMFAQKDGFSDDDAYAHLERLRTLIKMEDADATFNENFKKDIKSETRVAEQYNELRDLLA